MRTSGGIRARGDQEGLGWDHMDCCDLEGEVEGLRGLEIVLGGTLPQ